MSQASHFNNLNMAADRRIEELELTIKNNAMQIAEERSLAQKFGKEYDEKAELYYKEAYKREQWVIELKATIEKEQAAKASAESSLKHSDLLVTMAESNIEEYKAEAATMKDNTTPTPR